MTFDAFLQMLYDLPISQHIRLDYLWFPLIESIHVIAICIVVGSVFVVDLRLMGITSNKKPVTELAREVLPLDLGLLCHCPDRRRADVYLQAPTYFDNEYFRYKMILMALAGVNMAIFHFFTFKSVTSGTASAPTVIGAKIAGGQSCLFWIADRGLRPLDRLHHHVGRRL